MGVLMATLEVVRAAVAELKRVDGTPVPLRHDPGAGVRAAGPVGRVTVAPGQVVDPDVWGNVTYDQTVEVFVNAQDRSRQWPTPLEGARSWLDDQHSLWVFKGGAWRSPPLGWVASALGPATAVDVTGSGGAKNLVSVPLTVRGTRNLRIEFYWSGVNNSPGRSWVQMIPYTTVLPGVYYDSGAPVFGGWAVRRQLTASGDNVFTVSLGATAANGPVRFNANSCQVSISDMGA